MIDLTNLKPKTKKTTTTKTTKSKKKDLTIKSKLEKKKFYPMFLNPHDAVKASKTNTIHLAVPGLMPASPDVWSNYKDKNQIFYMPNDKKQHFHGDAPHHAAKFKIETVWLMSKNKTKKVKNKQIEEYRQKTGIQNFNKGESSTPIETWIHWRIPYNEEEYPSLKVRKDSIIWWDFLSEHNLVLVKTKKNYVNNTFTKKNTILISKNQPVKETLVTVMDKKGTYYFACSVEGHAEMGHKIKIKVI